MTVATIKWTISRGRDTEGYPICSLWIGGRKVASCNGGGYDLQSTVWAQYLVQNFADRLKLLKAEYGSLDPNHRSGKHCYGLVFWNKKSGERVAEWTEDCSVGIDGACGTALSIAHSIGVVITRDRGERKNISTWFITDERATT